MSEPPETAVRRTRHLTVGWSVQACAAGLLAVAGIAWAAGATLGFTSQVSQGLIAAQVRLFGPPARERLGAWVVFARALKASPGTARLLQSPAGEIDALQAVNSHFNRIPFVPDSSHWGMDDYWATPSETVSSNGGDCEDYSIAKYFMLKETGVPIERLRITYVKATRLNQAHMVLAYYSAPGAEPLILDNLEGSVRPASERSDLVPVYSFNDEDVVLARDARKASALQIRAWRDLIAKLEAEARL